MQFIIDQIYEEDCDFLDSDKIDNQLYLGLKYDDIDFDDNFLLSSAISPSIFFKYDFKNIVEYLYFYSNNTLFIPKIDIMKLIIKDDNIYTVILKTYWIRLIQRHWRSLLKKRAGILKIRCSLKALKYREINGNNLPGCKNLPTLRGLLSCYNSQKLKITK